LSISSANGRPKVTIDGNEAAAYVAHKTNEVIAIYPITPSPCFRLVSYCMRFDPDHGIPAHSEQVLPVHLP
jgi:pyruvate/2-oxoacid:ferredoxin oxidoreductase alpha subunit